MMLRSLLLACALAPLATAAAASPPEDLIRAEVLPGWRTDRGTHIAAFRLTLAPGWKTYWRAPGDGGIPPEFLWDGSRNVSAARFHWPVPDVWTLNGMRSIGYHDQIVLPVELTTPDGTAPAHVAGEIDLGVCQEICVPVRLSFAADLPAPGRRDPAIAAALVDRPLTAREAGLTSHGCRIEPREDGLQVIARLDLPATGSPEEVVIEAGDPQVWVSDPEVRRDGGTLEATVDMIHVSGGAFALDRSAIRITVLGSERAVDIQGCPAR